MRLVIIMTNDRFIAKLELTISTDRLQDSLWRAVGKGVNCTSCESKECLSYVWSETVVDGRKRGIEWWRQRGRERTVTTSLSAVRAFFVSPTITFHASLWAVPNPPPYSARPHIDTICSWKISIRFTRWRTVATEIKGIVDVFRVSLVSRRCQGICPSLAFDSTKEISCWACCRLRRFCLYNLLFLPLSFGKRENWRNAMELRVHSDHHSESFLRRCDVSFRLRIRGDRVGNLQEMLFARMFIRRVAAVQFLRSYNFTLKTEQNN